MKKFLSSVSAAILFLFAFAFVQPSFAVYPDYGGYSGAFHGVSPDSWVLESGGVLTIKSGGSLVVDSGANVSFSSSSTSNDLNLTYGINAATGVFSGAVTAGSVEADNFFATYGVDAATGVFSGAVTGASFAATGALSGATLATTGAATVVGAAYIGAANSVSTVAANGVITAGASVNATTSVSAGTFLAAGSYLSLPPTAKAAILALPGGAAGRYMNCSDCTAVTTCVSTGTAVGAWVKITDKAAACD